MRAPRYFVDAHASPGAEVALTADDGYHARHVLRLRAGAQVVVISDEVVYEAELLEIGAERALVRVAGRSQDQGGELPVEVVVVQALAKAAKFDEVVEKCVELGAALIVPVRCARDVAERGEHVERWRRIARAAAQQSRRRRVPDVTDVQSFADALTQLSSSHVLLIADPTAAVHSLARVLAVDAARPLALFVGPEGGFDDEERADAVRMGGRLVSLGPTTLRTETAAAALLAAVAASRGWW